ncbi:MAG TPA: helix-turn-helix transcriptional regulator [Gemmatimonadaceae bacterium]|nr:helix-turn-helix transcriptional regulator [Gemmatimonadaceae bacterium]
MIRTNSEYSGALRRLLQDRDVIAAQRAQLEGLGLSPEEVACALEPAISFHQQLKEEVETYESMKRGDTGVIENLNHIGRILIGLRIAADMSQAELARRLEVSESVISRDERNEYQGISVERAQRIVDALRGRLRLQVEPEDRAVERFDAPVAAGARR